MRYEEFSYYSALLLPGGGGVILDQMKIIVLTRWTADS